MLLSPSHLHKLLSSPSQSPRPILLDCSWHMPNSPRNANAEFSSGPRLPHAKRWDVDEVATRGEAVKGLPHMMPSGDVFAKYAASRGITRDSHVVCYDTLGVFSSPRAAFTFLAFGHEKVSILNGGLPAWVDEGYDIEQGQSGGAEEVPAEYPAPSQVQNGWIRSFEEMRANSKMAGRSQTVLDARPKGR